MLRPSFIQEVQHMSLQELREASELITEQWKEIQRRQAESFHPGDKVSFDSKRDGVHYTGRIDKINRQSIVVKVTAPISTIIRVSPSMLVHEN